MITAIGEYLFLSESYPVSLYIYGVVFFFIIYSVVFIMAFLTPSSKKELYNQLKLDGNPLLLKYFKVVVALNVVLIFLILVSMRALASPIFRSILLINIFLGILFIIDRLFVLIEKL